MSVTIGMGDDIHKSNAATLGVSEGAISRFITNYFFKLHLISIAFNILNFSSNIKHVAEAILILFVISDFLFHSVDEGSSIGIVGMVS